MAADAEFRLLGPLEVRRDGVLMPIAAGRQRGLLAALLLRPGKVISADELIELLWDGAPPASARASLHNYVVRLRHALGDASRDLLGTRSQGYLIDVEPGQLDLDRFEVLLGAARAQSRVSGWESAAGQARAALALWRGEPLADTGSEVLAAREAPRLAEMRLQALEVAIDAELQLGGQAAVLGEVRRLAAEHPLRERLHALLMLALCRDGRQAEALAAYRDARRVLAAELGIEPGPELQDLHQRILIGDAGLVLAESGQPHPDGKTAATWTLPRDLVSFTGRRAELAWLTAVEAGTSGIAEIHAVGGMAGVGKTTLAVHAAHQLAPQYPDGQFFVSLQGHTPGRPPADPAEALAGLLVTAGFAAAQIPAGLAERAGLWRDYLARRQVLLVLDDAVSSDQVEPLLPGTGGSLVLVTSRRHLTALPDARVISLDVLPPAEAAALLARFAARPGLLADDPAVAEICALCGYLPLAIAMLALQLHHHPAWTPAGLAAELAAVRNRMQAMTAENVSVAAAFDLSYADLGPDQQRLFRRLGLHPGSEIDAYAAAALEGGSLAAARRGLRGLYEHCLLTEPSAGRYRLHDLLGEHALAIAMRDDPASDRDRAVCRLLDYYTHTATLAETRLARQTRPVAAAPAVSALTSAVPELADHGSALAWARAERANLLACLDKASEGGDADRIVALTAGLADLLRHDGPWSDASTRHAAAAQAARQAGDQAGQANALNNLAIVQYLAGNQSSAVQVLEEALTIYRSLGSRQGTANVLYNLGFARYMTGDLRRAAEILGTALALSIELGDRPGHANALAGLGMVRRATSDYRGAARALQQALDMYRDIGDRPGQVSALNYLGSVRSILGDYPAAARALEMGLALARDLGSRPGEAIALANLGIVRRETSDYPGAVDFLRAALGLYRTLGNRQGQANALVDLGIVRRLTGDYQGAIDALQQALSTYRDLGDRGGEVEALNETGTLHLIRREIDQAEACHRQALGLAREIDSAWDEAHALAGLGRCAHALGQAADAEAGLRQAHQILQQIGATEATGIAAELDALAVSSAATGPSAP